jgi:predicted ferric reductase
MPIDSQARPTRSRARFIFGTRRDWHLQRPRWPRLQPGLHWIGPLSIVGTVIVSWFAFEGAQGEDGGVALGLWLGSASILLMAWSFVLAVRLSRLEPFFGGLDRMYRVHRWSGALAVGFMYLHTSVVDEVVGGIQGVSESTADSAESLAGFGQQMLYVLVGLSLVRLMPYRYWRWTHKLIGIPFAFASWHFFTAEKTYDNGSFWGIWFAVFMLVGLSAYLLRVFVRDGSSRGYEYRVVSHEHRGSISSLEIEPVGEPLDYRLGQFVFLKIDEPGMREPHAFTIASGPDHRNLHFFIRHLGDWTAKLAHLDLDGTTVRVEGPYGRFDPFGQPGQPTVWIAGGVGITPFLAALDCEEANAVVPDIFYATRSTEDNEIVDVLRASDRAGRSRLRLFSSEMGERLTDGELEDTFGPDGLLGTHVALCGPSRLVRDMGATCQRLGAVKPEEEDFDLRQGFGPDRSREVEQLLQRG